MNLIETIIDQLSSELIVPKKKREYEQRFVEMRKKTGSNVMYPFAFEKKTKKEVFIEEADSSFSFVCLDCGGDMIPKALDSEKVTPHFAHKKTSTFCEESIYHHFFKNRFAEEIQNGTILVFDESENNGYYYMNNSFSVEKEHSIFDNENKLKARCDIALLSNKKLIWAIEIVYTHHVDESTKAFYTENGIGCIEIDIIKKKYQVSVEPLNPIKFIDDRIFQLHLENEAFQEHKSEHYQLEYKYKKLKTEKADLESRINKYKIASSLVRDDYTSFLANAWAKDKKITDAGIRSKLEELKELERVRQELFLIKHNHKPDDYWFFGKIERNTDKAILFQPYQILNKDIFKLRIPTQWIAKSQIAIKRKGETKVIPVTVNGGTEEMEVISTRLAYVIVPKWLVKEKWGFSF